MIPWLSVLTSTRRPHYLQATLDELDAAGAEHLANTGGLLRWIAVDGDPALVPDRKGWVKSAVGNEQGSRRSLLRVIQTAAGGQARHLLHFEDDILPCRNAVLAMNHVMVPDNCGFLTAFTMRTDLQMGPDIRTAHRLAGGFWGTQALKIPGRSLQHLRDAVIPATDAQHSCDVWLGEQLASARSPWRNFKILRPSLFQHIGTISEAHPGERERRAWDYSREFNALTIFKR